MTVLGEGRGATARIGSIGAGLSGRDNAFGLLRLVLASAVIFSHAFPLGGHGPDPLLSLSNGQQSIGDLAVLGFFAVSGYLITKSGARNDILQFLWHRTLRIFPAFWVVLLVGALVVAPLVWVGGGRALGNYLPTGPGSPAAYLTQNGDLSIGQWGVYDVFAQTTPYGRLVGGSVLNGSLWTLKYEWTCYLIVGALMLFAVLKRVRPVVPMLTLAVLAVQVLRVYHPGWMAAHLPHLSYLTDPYRVTLTLVFLCGACLAVYSGRVPLHDAPGVLSVAAAVTALFTTGFALVGPPAVAYVVVWLAARLPGPLRRIGARNDYSYGVYVYGFLVEQLLAHLGVHEWGYLPYAVATLLVSAACAWVSWHAVEQPAMSWKDRGPGRGLRFWFHRARRRVSGPNNADCPVIDSQPVISWASTAVLNAVSAAPTPPEDAINVQATQPARPAPTNNADADDRW